MPRVSVIISNFNHAKYLTKRIESVINQTLQDFKIIIMSDLYKKLLNIHQIKKFLFTKAFVNVANGLLIAFLLQGLQTCKNDNNYYLPDYNMAFGCTDLIFLNTSNKAFTGWGKALKFRAYIERGNDD